MASNLKPPHPSSSKPPKVPNLAINNCTTHSNPPNPNSIHSEPSISPTAAASVNPFDPSPELLALSRASHLTRSEVLRLRSHRLKQLARCYRDHYWALMEELKVQFREYYWEYGVSPFREAQHEGDVEVRDVHLADIEGSGENGNHHPSNAVNNSGAGSNRIDLDATSNNQRCAFVGCKLKAMALTSFCHLHILSDPKQKLYKPCAHVIKRRLVERFAPQYAKGRDPPLRLTSCAYAQAGPITCGKPILRSTTPTLCAVHYQKFQKDTTRALRKAGLNVSSSSKLAPKFHILVSEYVGQIQAKRRGAAKRARVEVKQESGGS